MKIMTPNTQYRAQGIRLAPRPDLLRGKTVGFLDGWGFREDDGTISMYPLMREIKLLLAERYEVAKFVWLKKENVARKASAAQMMELVSRSDVVINGEAA